MSGKTNSNFEIDDSFKDQINCNEISDLIEVKDKLDTDIPKHQNQKQQI